MVLLMVKPYILPVLEINCHRPTAPELDLAVGINEDSTADGYFSSVGRPAF